MVIGRDFLQVDLIYYNQKKGIAFEEIPEAKCEELIPWISKVLLEREPILLNIQNITNHTLTVESISRFISSYRFAGGISAVDISTGQLQKVGLVLYKVMTETSNVAIRKQEDDPEFLYISQIVADSAPAQSESPYLLLGPIAVPFQFSDRGIGAFLIKKCIAEARKLGCKSISCLSSSEFLAKILEQENFVLCGEKLIPTFSKDGVCKDMDGAYPHCHLKLYQLPLILT